jgi:predicted amidophosphoribosyltransferase
MAVAWSGTPFDPEAVAWVPLSRARRAERGYDQARALALAVGPRLNRPVLPLLERVGDPGPQARRGGQARRAAMAGMFAPAGSSPERVLLVDDVLTTGATAAACAEALLSAGACEVALLCAARAVSSVRAGARSSPILAVGSRPGLWLPRGEVPR